MQQSKAFCGFFAVNLNPGNSEYSFRFVSDKHSQVRCIPLQASAGEHQFPEQNEYNVSTSTPLLIGLDIMTKYNIYVTKILYTLCLPLLKTKVIVTLKEGHIYLPSKNDIRYFSWRSDDKVRYFLRLASHINQLVKLQ